MTTEPKLFHRRGPFTLFAFALLLSACLVHQGAAADNSSEERQEQPREDLRGDEDTASGVEVSREEIEGDDRELEEDEQDVTTAPSSNLSANSEKMQIRQTEEVESEGVGGKTDQESEEQNGKREKESQERIEERQDQEEKQEKTDQGGKQEKRDQEEEQEKNDQEGKEDNEEHQEMKSKEEEEQDQETDPERNQKEEEKLENEDQDYDREEQQEKKDQEEDQEEKTKEGGQEENQEREEPPEKQDLEIPSPEQDELAPEVEESSPEYDVGELTKAHVSCGHVRKLLHVDSTVFGAGAALDECWHRGVSLADLALNVSLLEQDREDIEKYDLGDLYLPCGRVFRDEIVTKLTTSLLEDFLRCEREAALTQKQIEVVRYNFAEILRVYENGNASLTIDEDTLAGCRNLSKRITMLCRQYGLTEGQWSRGFLRYGFADKWAVEEELGELRLTCDRVFEAGLERELYEEPARVFLGCLETMTIADELRDQLEKKYADELLQLRAVAENDESPSDQPTDLRSYVSCKHVQPVRLRNGPASASWVALDLCKRRGRSYAQLMGGTNETELIITRRGDDEVDVTELYLRCKDVFNDELWSLSTPLLNDYESCKKAGAIKDSTKRLIRKRFADVFKLIAENRRPRASNVTERLVSCEAFSGKLAELCRERGSSLAQELRGTGSPARAVGPTRWINAEALDKLYVRCDDLFDEYARQLAKSRIPVERYSQCKWAPGASKAARDFIDKRLNRVYVKPPPRNSTGYEITELVVFDLNAVPDSAPTE